MYIVIIGCGRVGARLAMLLSDTGHNIVVVDRKPEALKKLGADFNGATVVGNGYELDVLKEAGIEKADVFCSLTNGDNTNIMAAEVAKKIFNVPRAIVRIYDSARAEIFKNLGLETISGTVLFASMIRDKVVERSLSSFVIETGEVGVLEFEAGPEIDGKTVAALFMAQDFSVMTIVRRAGGRKAGVNGERGVPEEVLIPSGETILKTGDRVYGVVRMGSIKKVKKALKISDT